jgi:hypothetical protein
VTGALRVRLPEVVVEGKRLGRHLHHDPRSLRYLVPAAQPATTTWERVTPVLDQGNLGSCVGNAFTGVLGSDVYIDTVPAGVKLDEAFAVKLYSLATQLDDYPGQYPPEDTGSDGLSGAKAVQQDALASGYTHATSLGQCYGMIARGPFAVGVAWHAGMDEPTAEGVVHATGPIRGGHEFEVLNYDAAKGLWEAVNSWGDSWAKGGHFYIPDADFAKLLAEQGDATQLTPAVLPAPQPTPGGRAIKFTDQQFAALTAWAASPHVWRKATAAAKAWAQAGGSQ